MAVLILPQEKAEEIIKKHKNAKEVKITKFTDKSGTEPGQNYSGDLTAVDITALVDGQEVTFHWIVKTPPVKEGRHIIQRLVKQEEKEVKMYNEYVGCGNTSSK